MRLYLTFFAQFPLLASLAFAQEPANLTRHVARAIPVASPLYQLSADRPQLPGRTFAESPATDASQGNKWKLLAALPGVIHDIAFPTAKIGYAAGEQGEVFKTTDGGISWTQLTLSNAANDYFYGVYAVTTEKIAISGFYDASSGAYGVFRWSEDGGRTWTNDMSPGPQWLQQVRFLKGTDGVMMPLAAAGSSPTKAEYTTTGGAKVSNWKSAVANPSGAWFDPQFSLLGDSHTRASGINFCTSLTGGSKWSCTASVDSVFDGPVFFLNDHDGWVGGGEISPSVEGWLHVTTNGGKTWSVRTLDGPWPIRSILFLNSKTGWAGGGDVYTDVGGIYFTTDGGNTWSVDATTNSEMGSCAQHTISGGHHQLWCAGFNYNNGFGSVIYGTQY
jgi:hypothetical protein